MKRGVLMVLFVALTAIGVSDGPFANRASAEEQLQCWTTDPDGCPQCCDTCHDDCMGPGYVCCIVEEGDG